MARGCGSASGLPEKKKQTPQPCAAPATPSIDTARLSDDIVRWIACMDRGPLADLVAKCYH
jgi:hypothetical protein